MDFGMQTGTFYFNEHTHPTQWNLSSLTGPRTFRVTIKFPQPFGGPPQLAVALTGSDAANTANLRIWIGTEDIEVGEFDLVVNTWDDTLIYGISGVWIAE